MALAAGCSPACTNRLLKLKGGSVTLSALIVNEVGLAMPRSISIRSGGNDSTSSAVKVGGSGGIKRLTRTSCSSGKPTHRSSLSGPVISSARNWPKLRPVTRRMVPGSHSGACAANASTAGSQAMASSGVSFLSMRGRPARWDKS